MYRVLIPVFTVAIRKDLEGRMQMDLGIMEWKVKGREERFMNDKILQKLLEEAR